MIKKKLGKVVKRVKELNEKIRIAREQVARREQLTACIDAVKTQRRELDRKLINLRVALREEEADVQKLENAKLSRFFLSLTGKLETRLEQERQEARQAAIRYDTAQKELLELDRQLAQYQKELGTLGDCHLRYQRLMGQKRERLKTESSEIAEKLQELERQALALRRQRKEVGEAITVGRQAKSTANGVLSKLEEALGYSTWDMMGGGLLADLAKHDTLDEAQALATSLQSLLRRFKTELADVQISSDLQVSIDGFLHFADYFFDSLFVDWAVRDRIESARGRIRDTMWQIDSVLNKLTAMQATLDARLAALQEKSDNLIQTTDL